MMAKNLAGIFYPSRVFMGCEISTTAKVSLEIVPTGVDRYLDGVFEANGLVSPVDALLSAVAPPLAVGPQRCDCGRELRGPSSTSAWGLPGLCPRNRISLFGDVRKRTDGSWWDGLLQRAGGGRFPPRPRDGTGSNLPFVLRVVVSSISVWSGRDAGVKASGGFYR